MRFLIILPTHPFPADTGQRHRYAHLARFLARRHDVALVYLTSQPDIDLTVRHANEFVEIVAVPERTAPVSLRERLGADPSDVFRYRSAEVGSAVQRIMERLSPEVVISGEPALTQYVTPYRDCIRVLDYLCEATLQFERMRRLSTGPQKFKWMLRKTKYAAFLRRIAKVYDLCIVNSAEDLAALREAAPQWRRIELIPNGLDLADYPLNLAEPRPGTLIYPGSIAYEPNRDAVEFMARDVLPHIRAQLPDAQFIVTGKIPDGVDPVRGEGLEFTGYLPDVKSAIAASWVCVVPLRLGAGGARFKVLEALALGSAVVSTAIGYEGVAVRDGVEVLHADDARTFANCCLQLLKSHEQRAKLAAAGRRLIEDQYNWAILGGRLVERIRELSEEARAVPAA